MSAYNASVRASEVPGLFNFTSNFEFWQSGIVLDGMIEYSYLTGDKQYDELISEGMQWQYGEDKNFMPVNQTVRIGNADQSSWGLAAMTAAETGFTKPQNGEWIDYAKTVFDTLVLRYKIEEGGNGTCDGGLRLSFYTFMDEWDLKDMNSNGNFFLLAARLARFTGNETYAAWADKTYSWAKNTHLISKNYEVFYGTLPSDDCETYIYSRWSDIMGLVTEGAAIMYNIVRPNYLRPAIYKLMKCHRPVHKTGLKQ
jgi:mannan endo-1,6-alpha-mannosidase